jgi:hypothetical protein
MALANLVPAETYDQHVIRLRQNDPDCLAPKFRERSEAAITDANTAGLEIVSFETCRSNELAKLYYEHGVSRAPTALYTWHYYGLARDVISREHGWDLFPGGSRHDAHPSWWREVYRIFRSHQLDAGADWVSFHDFPHWQFGGMKASPSDHARQLLHRGGVELVWRAVGAVDDAPSGILPGVPLS